MPRLHFALMAIPLVLSSGPAAAQSPAAPEFIVNTFTTNAQALSALSMDARGNFVVVWQSALQDGSLNGVFGQRFDAAGGRRGAEFRVNSTTTGSQSYPDVAVDSRGDFVVVWTDYQGGPEIKARLFDRSGAALGGEFRVNDYTTGVQTLPRVAADAAGNFVVVWQSAGQDGSGLGVFGHRFDASGHALGADFVVNTYTTGDEQNPDVALLANGGFVVVFEAPDAFGNGVHARRFDASGAPQGAQVSVTTAAAAQFSGAVAGRPQGGFVVAWTSYSQDGSHNGIFGRIFDAAGAPVTGEIAVNTYTTNAQSFPAVATDGLGRFVVIWESVLQDGNAAGVFGQRFDAAGARRGTEFQLNAFTTGAQANVAVASDSAGNFTAAWDSAAQDGSASAVVGRRFQGLLPTALVADLTGNGILEPGEGARLDPSWRNATQSPVLMPATASNFTGPPPAIYTLIDGSANYGTIAPNTTVSCANGADCYLLGIATSMRPAQHWDATLIETPAGSVAAQGLQKQWVLHVGDSFADVPRTSQFYRLIETLLHNGVTGGCTTTDYCPTAITTRDAMAVFVLVGREGPGFTPPACLTPVFADVPASSGFCRWVEELARRGVVTGCGGGNYCPSAAVTREQMAVFVLRTLNPTFTPPACGTPVFADVPASSSFCAWIEELFRRGVVTGCGGGNYCPADPVTREQMGVFISSTFGLVLYGP